MRGLRSVAALTVCLMSVGLLLAGCSAKGNPQTGSSVEEQGITQAEAQALWDGMGTAFGGDEWGNRQSEIETATLAAFDVWALMDSAWAEDIGSRVLAVNPDVMKENSGEGEFPGYMEVDKAGREGVRSALSSATSADLVADAWTVWNTVEGEDGEYRIPNLPWQAFSVLTDAVVRPSTAATRVVSVEGTGTILVTFKTNFTWSMGTDYDADWTNRYTVEKRDGKWVITGITNLGDYAVAVTESDLKRAKEAGDAATAKPSDDELKKHFTVSNIKWIGQDKQGRWWVASMFPDYSDLQVRNAPDDWEWVSGSRDMGFRADLIPQEVAMALKKAGLTVYE